MKVGENHTTLNIERKVIQVVIYGHSVTLSGITYL